MSLVTLAIVNGALAVALLAALAYVCILPFRLENLQAGSSSESVAADPEVHYERFAA